MPVLVTAPEYTGESVFISAPVGSVDGTEMELRSTGGVTDTGPGTGTRTYQWTENGIDIVGATNPTYNATHAGAGTFTYNCKVTDDGGCVDVVDATGTTSNWIADWLPNCVQRSMNHSGSTTRMHRTMDDKRCVTRSTSSKPHSPSTTRRPLR